MKIIFIVFGLLLIGCKVAEKTPTNLPADPNIAIVAVKDKDLKVATDLINTTSTIESNANKGQQFTNNYDADIKAGKTPTPIGSVLSPIWQMILSATNQQKTFVETLKDTSQLDNAVKQVDGYKKFASNETSRANANDTRATRAEQKYIDEVKNGTNGKILWLTIGGIIILAIGVALWISEKPMGVFMSTLGGVITVASICVIMFVDFVSDYILYFMLGLTGLVLFIGFLVFFIVKSKKDNKVLSTQNKALSTQLTTMKMKMVKT